MGTKVLANESHQLGVLGYGLKPKLHACDHIAKDLGRQLHANAPRVLSPMATSCESTESIIGHVSRLARHVFLTKQWTTWVMERVHHQGQDFDPEVQAKVSTHCGTQLKAIGREKKPDFATEKDWQAIQLVLFFGEVVIVFLLQW